MIYVLIYFGQQRVLRLKIFFSCINLVLIFLSGFTAIYNCFSLGISYRNKDTFIATLVFQNRLLHISCSLDYTAKVLTNTTNNGSHEVKLKLP